MFVKVIQANWHLPSKREIELKENVMDIMKKRGVIQTAFSITPMITLYGKVGDFYRADGLLCMMKKNRIKRSNSTYNSMMKSHLNNKAKVSDLCDQMTADRINPNVYTYNTMIRAFAKDAAKVDEPIKPNVYIYSLMIDIYAKSGKMEEAIEMFDSMKKGGI
jgi:pentatricopeptide repeat protein